MQSKTQSHSNVLKLLQKSSQALKTFFQLLQIKRLQLKLTNTLQNSYQIQSQHQVPRTWVKQHPKTPQTTKTNEHPSPSSSMHKLVPFGSKLVPIGSYGFSSSQIGSYKLKKRFPNCSPAHTLFQDRFQDVPVGARWFSTLYIPSPTFTQKGLRMTQVDQSWGLFDQQFFNATGEDHFLESKANVLQLRK